MRISLNWLRELVEFDLEPESLAQLLTMAGFEVEDIEDRRTWAAGVVLGKVLTREQHPNADKLSVCQVDIGAGEPSTIVCGAANVAADLFVPVATVGAFLPKVGDEGLKIRPTKLRGVLSSGMICSLAELGLAKESAGIHSFTGELPPLGSEVGPLLGLDDVILDLTSTANRADALSMVGVAREVAGLTGGKLHLPVVPALDQLQQSATALDPKVAELKITIADPEVCPAYLGTTVTGVTIAPSPLWLQRRLEASGIRAINNVVDITNYILLTWGQPLHAFDRDRLQEIVNGSAANPDLGANLEVGVRFANAGETLITLDGQTRQLQPQNLLITANQQPVALAGVMGGQTTEVEVGTRNLLLEAALFSSIAVRRSARAVGLRTEASTRYERGVNATELDLACRHGLQLLQELAGGRIHAQVAADSRTLEERTLTLRLERVQQVLGPVELGNDEIGELQPERISELLTSLGFQLSPLEADQTWQVQVPAYRHRDIEREIDLIEEIARLHGYNNFCDTLPGKTELGYLPLEEFLTRQLREALRAAGLTELVHYSWVKAGASQQISVINPLLIEFSSLRTELLTQLLNVFQYNLEQGNGPLNGFEIGRIFWQAEQGLTEADAVAGIIGGDPEQGRWLRHSQKEQPLSWFDAKGVLESVFARLGLTVEYQPDCSDPRLHPGRTASLWLQGERLGTFGQLHPQLRQSRDLPAEVYLFQLDLEVLLEAMLQQQEQHFAPFSTFPALERDLAFFASVEISVTELERTMRKAAATPNGTLLESIELFDEYRGESVPEGQRSLAFRLRYRTLDRTLTDAEVNPVQQQIREALGERYRVQLRS